MKTIAAKPSVTRIDGNYLVKVKFGVKALRSVQVGLIELAYAISEHPDSEGVLVLPDASVTRQRLKSEWDRLSLVFRPELLERLNICIGVDTQLVGILKDMDENTRRIIEESINTERVTGSGHHFRADFSFVVVELLIHQWLLGAGPMTTDWLMKTAGCGYQTVAKVLRRLDHRLMRRPDRRIELRMFPREEWAGLVANSERARGTIRFADRSGLPRSWGSKLERLRLLGRQDVAIGGVMGAKYHYPPLDLVGNPRVDLSLHCPGKEADLSFVEGIDPALVRTERRDEPPALVVHLVRRAEPLFCQGNDGVARADPVECLLDLHEARLEAQAREFLNSFPTVKGHL